MDRVAEAEVRTSERMCAAYAEACTPAEFDAFAHAVQLLRRSDQTS